MRHYLVPVLLMYFCWIGPALMKVDAHTSQPQFEQSYPVTAMETEVPELFLDLQQIAQPIVTQADSSKQDSQVGTMFQQVVDWLYPRQPEPDSTKQE